MIPPRGRAWVLAALAAAGALLAAVLLLVVTVRTDMAEFLPEGRTEAARLVTAEARSGASTGLVLVGVEGAPTGELARVARAMGAALPGTGLFAAVLGGGGMEADRALLFDRRFQLSPAVTADAFTEDALRTDMVRLLAAMRSSLGAAAGTLGLRDPTGAFLALVRGLGSGSGVRVVDGAWVSADGGRALLLVRTRAGGMDIPAQERGLALIGDAFRAAEPAAGARLVLAGPAVFARDAAAAMKGDVERISALSTVAVLLLLWWRFRSLLVLAAVAAPVVASVAVAALAVQALFGAVHGVALGFGATMLGVSVDYPVLLIGHRKRGEAAPDTRARIGAAFRMAVAAAVLGLAAMVFSGFPGLVQLGVFAAVGLLACAALTWWVLPALIVKAELAPVAAGDPSWLARVEGWRRFRFWGLVPVAAAVAVLAVRGVDWEGDLQALSPVPAESLALDRAMRADVGAGDAGPLLLVRGETAEAVLQAQEALAPELERLRAAGTVAGWEMAAGVLPSARTQRARVAALPEMAVLRERVAGASAGLGFRAGAFDGFEAEVAAARGAGPLEPQDLDGTALGARLSSLLLRRGTEVVGPVVLRGLRDGDAVRAAVGERAVLVDVRRELGTILAETTARAWWWLGASAAAVAVLLGAGLRDPWLAGRVAGSVAAALLVTLGVLAAAGARVSLIHLVALQLVAGVGLDYALFFARRQLDTEERARTLRTLVTCNAMTLLTFGLLAGCQTPLLRDIGITVALGAVLAMGFAFLFAGAGRGED